MGNPILTLAAALPAFFSFLAPAAAGRFQQNQQNGQPAAEAKERAREILKNPRYQNELPTGGGRPRSTVQPRESGGTIDDRPERRRESSSSGSTNLPSGGGDFRSVMEGMLWVLGAAFLIYLIYFIITNLSYFKFAKRPKAKDTKKPDVTQIIEPAGAPADSPLLEFEKLAREGRYTEAIHALLLFSVASIERSLQKSLPRSATGREIVAIAGRSFQVGEPLLQIVREVEISIFGGRARSMEDYDRCLRSYHLLLNALPAAERQA